MTSTKSTDETFLVTATIYVSVRVKNRDVIERVTGPGGDEWRGQFYPMIRDAEDVAEHFAFNAISNVVHDISELDGWADCDSRDVEIAVEDTEFCTEIL